MTTAQISRQARLQRKLEQKRIAMSVPSNKTQQPAPQQGRPISKIFFMLTNEQMSARSKNFCCFWGRTSRRNQRKRKRKSATSQRRTVRVVMGMLPTNRAQLTSSHRHPKIKYKLKRHPMWHKISQYHQQQHLITRQQLSLRLLFHRRPLQEFCFNKQTL